MKVLWTAQAQQRLTTISSYVAEYDHLAAERLIDRLIRRGDALRRFPHRGREVAELPGSGIRALLDGNYRIVYRVRDRVVQILTVFEGHRRLRKGEIAGQ